MASSSTAARPYNALKGDWQAAGLDLASLAVPLVSARAVRSGGNTADAFRAACSFAGDTDVLMANGDRKAISEIQVGDLVLAAGPETGETGPREVLATLPHTDQLLALTTSAGDIITTEDHRFWNVTDQHEMR